MLRAPKTDVTTHSEILVSGAYLPLAPPFSSSASLKWGELPAWARVPNAERVPWLNQYILAFWPALGKCVCDQVGAGGRR